MAFAQTMSPQVVHQHYRDMQAPETPPMQRRHASKMRFVADLSQCLFDFVIQLLPTAEEMAVKEDVRKLLERLIRTIEPDSRLLSFGSTANGFSLRNSDMDLCCLIDSKERLAATDLVTMLGDLLERETKFHVKTLPHARIPIVKLSLDPSPGLPLGIACDIGFENRLALENTRLLMCYAMIDPTRIRTLVLFLKVWSKRRKINSPYKGTLSSYGYVLLVIYFLVHVKNPPVLPNLQQVPPMRPITTEETHLSGYNTWFFDDIELLRQRWHSENTEGVAELLIDFFRYFSRDFAYNTHVASIRAGILKKESKGWQNEFSSGRYNDSRDRNRFCIEDPFETDYNVARCVTKDGLYTIRGEFMRAARVLANRPERAIIALAELCEERKDEDLVSAPPYHSPRVSLPPQTPYSVGSRSKGLPDFEQLPPTKPSESDLSQPTQVSDRPPSLEHMAPKRSKWTSPPPAEAPSADHSLFQSQLDVGLELATSSTEAREKEGSHYSPSSNGEGLTDEENRSDAAESDEAISVRSYTEGLSNNGLSGRRRPSWHAHDITERDPQALFVVPGPGGRVRYLRGPDASAPPTFYTPSTEGLMSTTSHAEIEKPPIRGSPRPPRGPSWVASNTPVGVSVPLPPSPDPPSFPESSTVYYQTTVPRSPRPNILYHSPGSQPTLLSQYMYQQNNFNAAPPPDIFPSSMPPSLTSMSSRIPRVGPETPTPATYSHTHSYSTTTVTAPTPPPSSIDFDLSTSHNSHSVSSLSPVTSDQQSSSKLPQRTDSPRHNDPSKRLGQFIMPVADNGSSSPQPSSTNSNGSSPAPSSTGYTTSISRSPSPHSQPPSPPATAVPINLTTKIDDGSEDISSTLATVELKEESTPPHIADTKVEPQSI